MKLMYLWLRVTHSCNLPIYMGNLRSMEKREFTIHFVSTKFCTNTLSALALASWVEEEELPYGKDGTTFFILWRCFFTSEAPSCSSSPPYGGCPPPDSPAPPSPWQGLLHPERRSSQRQRCCRERCSCSQPQLQHKRASARQLGDPTGGTSHGDGILPSPWPVHLPLWQRWVLVGVHAGDAANFPNSGTTEERSLHAVTPCTSVAAPSKLNRLKCTNHHLNTKSSYCALKTV